jgi:hypothetical protein
MRFHLRNKFQKGSTSNLRAFNSGAMEMDEILRRFHESARVVAERPNSFWAKQRSSIEERLQSPIAESTHRPALLWISAAIVILLCLSLFVEKSKAPPPDLAAGSDQDLLVEVEQALNRDRPEALAPAALIAQEIEQANRSTGQSSVGK